jgi:hypothetical protein
MPDDARARIVDNPFYVLGLATSCSRQEFEREGQKWLAMLDVGLSAARAYATPLGGQPRNADKVRQAMAELRDPERRLVHELWASIPVDVAWSVDDSAPDLAAAFPEARAAAGWRAR